MRGGRGPGVREASFQVTWSLLANERPVSKSRDHSQPIRGQYPSHVITQPMRGQCLSHVITLNQWKSPGPRCQSRVLRPFSISERGTRPGIYPTMRQHFLLLARHSHRLRVIFHSSCFKPLTGDAWETRAQTWAAIKVAIRVTRAPPEHPGTWPSHKVSRGDDCWEICSVSQI